MNRSFLHIALIVSVLSLMCSCIKEVEFTGEETAPQPVVNAVVADGDSICNVQITNSMFFLRRGTFPFVTDADVTLHCNGTDFPLALVHDSVYTTRRTFSAGDEISLSATIPSHGTLVSQTVVVPSQPVVVDAVAEHSIETGNASLTLTFCDNRAQRNYYRIQVYHTVDDTSAITSENYEYISCYDTRTVVMDADFPSVNLGTDLLFSDIHFSTDTCKLKIDFLSSLQLDNSYYVVFQNISESMYKYGSTLSSYYDSRNSPFSEPVQVYTNIDGGLGILAAKAEVTRKITIRQASHR